MAAFVGTAEPGDFAIVGDTVVYAGPDEWSYRRLILHYAKLCKAAGGVDAFLIGSELRGLTTLRSDANTYPFVDRLKALAEDVRQILGPVGEDLLRGRLDASISGITRTTARATSSSISTRSGRTTTSISSASTITCRSPTGATAATISMRRSWDSARSAAYLRANVAGGEGFDWYYAEQRAPRRADAHADHRRRLRQAVGLPATRTSRPGGGTSTSTGRAASRRAAPTAWVPRREADLVHRARLPGGRQGRQPAQRLPRPEIVGERDPLLSRPASATTSCSGASSRRCSRYWDADDPDHVAGSNPVSGVYGGRMVRQSRTHLWTWDARPFPAFPYLLDVWADGENWETGHWLTGRLGARRRPTSSAASSPTTASTGVTVGELDGIVDGYLIDGIVSARQALEPLASLLMFEAFESGDAIRIAPRGRKTAATFGDDDLVDEAGTAAVQPAARAGDGTAAGDRDRLHRPARRFPRRPRRARAGSSRGAGGASGARPARR